MIDSSLLLFLISFNVFNKLNEIELIKANNDYINKLYIKKKLTSKLNKNVACNKCLNTNFF